MLTCRLRPLPCRRLLPALLAGVALNFVALPTAAVEGLRLGGFASLGQVSDNRAGIAPVRDISQRPDRGADTGSGWKVDSRLGLQLEYGLSPDVNLVGQLVVRDQERGDPGRSTELAYLALRPLPDLDLRLGRINYDAFLMSDHRNVGYAYTWVRPPGEFYGWIPIFSIDGIDAAWTLPVDDGQWRIKFQLGRSKVELPIGDGYSFRTRNLAGASIVRQSTSWRFKAAWSRFTVGSEVPAFAPLHQGLEQVAAAGLPGISAEAAELRRELGFRDSRIAYATVGASYDDGVWLGQAELGATAADVDVIPHGRMAYASLGRRFGAWTPYLGFSASRPGNDLRGATHDWGALNATLRDRALFVVNATRIEQDTATLGLRWDLHPQAALKLQWDSTRIRPSGYGLWWRDISINLQPSRVNVVTTTLDFVF